MTEDNDLVERLREMASWEDGVGVMQDFYCGDEMIKAADSIEALTEQLKAARLDAKEAEAYSVWLEAKLGKTEDFVRRVIRYADNNGDDFLADKGREALLELRGENDD
jgi:hypothetical protein